MLSNVLNLSWSTGYKGEEIGTSLYTYVTAEQIELLNTLSNFSLGKETDVTSLQVKFSPP